MLPDTTVIQTHGTFDVLGQRFEIQFPDGSTVGLHPVREHGGERMFLRCLPCRDGVWMVFDLRKLCRELEHELVQAAPRDQPGMVFYSLRHRYPHAQAFADRVQQCWLAAWRARVRPTADAVGAPA